jgi:hypothetical protein
LNQQLAANATESTWDSVKAGSHKSYDALVKVSLKSANG